MKGIEPSFLAQGLVARIISFCIGVDSAFSYWAVFDVNANDLQTVKQLCEEQMPLN